MDVGRAREMWDGLGRSDKERTQGFQEKSKPDTKLGLKEKLTD